MLAYDFYGLGSAPLFLEPPPPRPGSTATTQLQVQLKVLTPSQEEMLAKSRAPLRPLSDRQMLCLFLGYKKVDRKLAGTGAPQAVYIAELTPVLAAAGIPMATLQTPKDLEVFFEGAIWHELWDRDIIARGSKTDFTPKGQMWLWTAPPKVFYVAGGAAVGVGALVWFLKFKR